MENNSAMPQQRVSQKHKRKEDFKWAKETMEALIKKSAMQGNDKRRKLTRFYDLYNGNINHNDYKYVTNPYDLKTISGNDRRYPARFRNYNIIRPVVDQMVGEKSRRPQDPKVIVRNPDSQSVHQKGVQQQLVQNYQAHFINELNKLGIDTGMESQDVPMPQELMEELNANPQDKRASTGQDALWYITQNTNFWDTMEEGFRDYLISGYVHTKKDIAHDDVQHRLLSPMALDYGGGTGVKYVQDADWVTYRDSMTKHQIQDMFYKELTEAQMEQLEDSTRNGGAPVGLSVLLENVDPEYQNPNNQEDRFIEVIHCEWQSFRKIGFLTYLDEMGVVQEDVVDETYKFSEEDGDINIEWSWINEVWEGYVIDKDIYLGIGPVRAWSKDMVNLSEQKLTYNGRAFYNRFTDNISVVSSGEAFQELYNIFHYRLELSQARNKDKIALIDISAIPKKPGWDEETFMYHANANGFAFIDPSQTARNGKPSNFSNYQVLDMGLGQYMSAQFDMLQAIKSEWEELWGMTRQRKGQSMATDGQGVTERAVFQATMASETMFKSFDQFEEKELESLLDLSKLAWKKGKKASYFTSDYRQMFLDIDGEAFGDMNFGVFISKSSAEREKLDMMKSMIDRFAQSGAGPTTIAEILDTDNFGYLKDKLRKVEEAQAQMQQQAQQAEQQAVQQQLDHESKENAIQREHEKELKRLDAAVTMAGQDLNENGVPDAAEMERFGMENMLENRKQSEAERANRAQEQLKKEEISQKRKDSEIKLKIAKENKNKHDSK